MTTAHDHAADQPPPINTAPGATYAADQRPFQGIPGIEREAGGRLFATWYACGATDADGGGDGEGDTNYPLLVISDDDGATWSEPLVVIDPPGQVRAFDPCLWIDPLGRLWLFWAQSWGHWDGRGGVWAIRCDAPAAAELRWTAPRRLCDGIMMNKPTVLRDGTWLLPAAVWQRNSFREDMAAPRADMADQRFSNVIASTDDGETFVRRGGADVPGRTADEHMVVELRDGRLWMLVRTGSGIGESYSTDGGVTWSPGVDAVLDGPSSRFCIRRLHSGELLLINHQVDRSDPAARPVREKLTAYLSDDDGQTWIGGLMLDERRDVSYPDFTESADGRIYAIHDRDRTHSGEIVLSVFTPADVRAATCLSPTTRLRHTINRLH